MLQVGTCLNTGFPGKVDVTGWEDTTVHCTQDPVTQLASGSVGALWRRGPLQPEAGAGQQVPLG